MAVGSTISTIFDDFSIFMDDHFFTPASLMVVISICLMIVAITGCAGAIKESTMLVNIVSKSHREWFPRRLFIIMSHGFIFLGLLQFAVLLFVVFAMELTAAVLAYIMHGQVEMMLIRTMNDSFMMYKEKIYVQDGIDFLQENVSRMTRWLKPTNGETKAIRKWRKEKSRKRNSIPADQLLGSLYRQRKLFWTFHEVFREDLESFSFPSTTSID